MKLSFFSTLFTALFVIASLLPKYATASQIGYIFPKAKNCTVYDHALIRVGAQVAHRMSMFTTEDNNSVDEDMFYLNEYDSVVPSIRITSLNLQTLEVEYSIGNDDMELLMFGKHVLLVEGSNSVPEEWSLKLSGDNEEEGSRFLRQRKESLVSALNNNATNHTRRLTKQCCICVECECCSTSVAACDDGRCFVRKLGENENDRILMQKNDQRLKLLADLARPIFEVIDVPCLRGNLSKIQVVVA